MENIVRILIDKSKLVIIIEKIKNKIKKTNKISFINLVNNINSIKSLNTTSATANAEDIIENKTAYVKGELITGTMSTIEVATPNIEVNENSGLITATINQNETGYINSGIKTTSVQFAFQPAITVNPTSVDQIVASKRTYVGGNITVKGDSNLKAENIKDGVSIFGVNGNYVGKEVDEDTNVENSIINKTITSYTNNNVTKIGNGIFYSCTSLTSINFPVCKTIGIYAFYACTSLTSVSFPSCTTIGSYAFNYCKNLTSASFPVCTTIGSYAFENCTSLSQIYLMASIRCTLSNSNAFSSTAIWSNKGSIFVPTSLVNSYKTATNWTFFSNRIFGV